MATISVEIPNGEYCSDDKRINCLYAQHCRDEHFCHLFRHYLGDSERYYNDNGEIIRLIRKCKPCLEALNGNVGSLAITVNTEDKHA